MLHYFFVEELQLIYGPEISFFKSFIFNKFVIHINPPASFPLSLRSLKFLHTLNFGLSINFLVKLVIILQDSSAHEMEKFQ